MTKIIKHSNSFLPPLKMDNQTIITNIEKANAIANAFNSVYSSLSINSTSVEDCNVKLTLNELNNQCNDKIDYTSPSEIKSIIHSLKNSKSPGNDNIHNLLLKHCPRNVHILLTYLFNSCFSLSYFPYIWKHAIVIPIPKPFKDTSNPINYRPISLLCSLSKVFERIIQFRLLNHIETKQCLPNIQFGFRQFHSTNHQVKRLAQTIKVNINNKRSIGVVLLDVEKAFDCVWHEGLLFKFIKLDI